MVLALLEISSSLVPEWLGDLFAAVVLFTKAIP